MQPLVKICGITNLQDAQLAIAAGAEMIGLIFCGSPRQVSVVDAMKIRRKLGEKPSLVGVFRDQPADFINEVADKVNLRYVQLHGGESAQVIEELRRPAIKAIQYSYEQSQDEVTFHHAGKVIADLNEFQQAKYILVDCQKGVVAPLTTLDSHARQILLGTLRASFDSIELPQEKLFLAGGLTVDTVSDACAIVEPIGLDVCSGVESAPGTKSEKLIDLFMKSVDAHRAEFQLKGQVASTRWRG